MRGHNITWAQVSLFFFVLWACTGSLYWLLGSDQAARTVALVFWPCALTAGVVALLQGYAAPAEAMDAGPAAPVEVRLEPGPPALERLAFRCTALQAGDMVRVVATPPTAASLLPGSEAEVVEFNAETGVLTLNADGQHHHLPAAEAHAYVHLLAMYDLPAVEITLPNRECWRIEGEGLERLVAACAADLARSPRQEAPGEGPARRDAVVRVQKQILNASREPVQWLLKQPWTRVEAEWAHRVVEGAQADALWKRARISLVHGRVPDATQAA